MEPTIHALSKLYPDLNQKELEAYHKYLESKKPPMAANTAANFFALYLNGYSAKEIADLNPSFGLGMIVRAKVDYEWDKARKEQLENLTSNIKAVVQKTQLEAIRFVADGLTVYQKLAGESFQKYLQTGKEDDLGDYGNISFSQYKALLELLLKLTGQDGNKNVSGDVVHRHVVEPGIATIKIDRPFTAVEADNFLQQLDTGVKPK